MYESENSELTESERAGRVLMPHAMARIRQMREKRIRLVHYTSAESAMRIIQSERFWLRNTMCMNDWSEVRFGIDQVARAYSSENGVKFQQALNTISPSFTDKLQQSFDPQAPTLITQTYVGSFSEHLDSEDEHGRLSMWRSYGATTGIALVMNNPAFIDDHSAPLNFWTTPVAYFEADECAAEFGRIAEGLQRERDWLSTLPAEQLLNCVLLALVFASISMKHVGFKEEREWRVVHLPRLFQSNRLEFAQEAVGGIPQPIYRLPMRNYPEEGFVGAELGELVSRVIVGPTQYPLAVKETFVELLKSKNVPNAEDKVVCSGIPLRC